MDNRKYTIKHWGSRIIMNATTTPGWKRVIGKGDLKFLVSKSDKSVIKIARHMRIRPEAVFKLLSDAFDESLVNRTVVVKDGCISFDSRIAMVMLDPGEDGHSWGLTYRAKEAMFNKSIAPHAKEAYTIPETLFC